MRCKRVRSTCMHVQAQLCDNGIWLLQSGGTRTRFLIFLNEFSDSSPIYIWDSAARIFVLLQTLATNRATSAVFFVPPPPPELCNTNAKSTVLYLAIAQVSCLVIFPRVNTLIVPMRGLPLLWGVGGGYLTSALFRYDVLLWLPKCRSKCDLHVFLCRRATVSLCSLGCEERVHWCCVGMRVPSWASPLQTLACKTLQEARSVLDICYKLCEVWCAFVEA
jgi:hypothetical protein